MLAEDMKLRSKTKCFITHATERILCFMFTLVLSALYVPSEFMWSDSDEYCTRSKSASQLRDFKLSKSKSAMNGLLENLLKYLPRGRHYLYHYGKQKIVPVP